VSLLWIMDVLLLGFTFAFGLLYVPLVVALLSGTETCCVVIPETFAQVLEKLELAMNVPKQIAREYTARH
jgi:hypothetical protein